ncbi:T9SS C-terminal target domain-containing protein [Lacihabitans sp. LS3-19]|uniref:S8 family peptidase n=1 Tax=Lacihabitans sp. LS3-19 TaxID=2487335 RepID=UPI0020CD0826|nr:S8 family peptidase [Lacihabitans sp. LS3-19]MCP9769825.1 T9SS C-terminal target domain-containing protein [Lacihabitans sp. LS3-19]
MKLIFKIIFIVFFASYHSSFGQNRYFVYLKDKNNSAFSISSPEKFLSPRSLQRRQKQSIPIISRDLPVNIGYISQIQDAGAKVIRTSKWLNAVLIESSPEILTKVSKLNFVKSVDGNQDIRGARTKNAENVNLSLKKLGSEVDYSYGNSMNQIQQLGADEMHKDNYTGVGILVAVFDAGFDKLPSLAAFSHLFSEKKIVKTFDFVDNDTTVYESHWHGTAALSCIAAKLPGQMIGTAPDASIALFKTEDVNTETRIEEVYWLFAAEMADSLGVDVINSSLGYYEFDNPATNYKFEDLNGDKTISAQAADFAVATGIIVVNSAGNEGGNGWNHLVTPSDADSVLTIAAVDANGLIVGFSSPGPNAKGNIKPELSAKGSQTSVIVSNPNASTSSGTSFSSPLIAGFAASFKQAFPDYSAMKIRDILIKSASQYETPDNRMGYGIPNYKKAYQIALEVLAIENTDLETIIYPNPIEGNQLLNIKIGGDIIDNNKEIRVFDSFGRIINQKYQTLAVLNQNINNLPSGVYIIKFRDSNQNKSLKLIKN